MANFKQYIKTSFQDYGLPSNSHTGDTYSESCAREDVQYLYNKIKNFSREVTQWDLYKITQVVTNQENFKSQVNNLPPYSSAIIAARFIGDDGRTYNQGDLVYKKLDGTTQHINAERGGVFYPNQIKKLDANNYTINFQYLSREPSEDKDATVTKNDNIWTVEKPLQAQKISFEGLTAQAPTSIYGEVLSPIPDSESEYYYVEFNKKDNIFPIIKLYNTSNEEVYADFSLGENGSKYRVTKLPSIVKQVVIK